jgi:hypothetical protein
MKGTRSIPSSIKKSDGTFTSGFQDTLNCIVETVTTSTNVDNRILVNNTLPSSSSISPLADLDMIFSHEVINSLVNDLKSFKSPGPDLIFNIMIQKSWDSIQHLVIDLFKHSLSTGCIPLSWQHSFAALIPKSRSLKSPSSFRVINLSCNFLKLMEKAILIFLQEGLNVTHSTSQFGFKLGTSTDTALNKLYSTLNSNYKRNIPSLGIFIDLKSAFDNLTFDSITAALHQLEVPQHIIHWICGSAIIFHTDTSHSN